MKGLTFISMVELVKQANTWERNTRSNNTKINNQEVILKTK